MWRSRIADRYNAPHSVSRVRSGFRDDCVGGVCREELPQCCLPLLALRSLKTLRTLSLGKNITCGILCVENFTAAFCCPVNFFPIFVAMKGICHISFEDYLYDADGERVWKFTGTATATYSSGQIVSSSLELDKTFYPTQHVTIDNHRLYKHYFIGGERICTEVTMWNALPILQGNHVGVIHGNASQFVAGLGEQVRRALDSVGYNGDIAYNQGNYSIPGSSQIYYYHYNHQGSVALVTNMVGTLRQHLQYLPYGGIFVDHRTGSYSSTYTFSAKEKDSESGYTYFGERYYSDGIMQWLSVDPMSDKYPSMSPYMYCAGNPVMLRDPDGMDFDPEVDHENKTITIKATYYVSKENEKMLNSALDVWKSQNGNYYFQPEGSKDEYTINFDFEMIVCENQDEADHLYSNAHLDGKPANLFRVGDVNSKDAKGDTYDGSQITVSSLLDSKQSIRTAAHEVGHTLGISHFEHGLMATGGRGSEITNGPVANILQTAGFNVKIPDTNRNNQVDYRSGATSKTNYNLKGRVFYY